LGYRILYLFVGTKGRVEGTDKKERRTPGRLIRFFYLNALLLSRIQKKMNMEGEPGARAEKEKVKSPSFVGSAVSCQTGDRFKR